MLGKYNQEEIRDRVQELYNEADSKSMRAFCNKIGLNQSNLSKKLSGSQNFTKRDLMLICKALQVNLVWLSYGKGDKSCVSVQSSVSDLITDENTKLRIEKARLEERVLCLENEKAFLQKMLVK